MLHLASTTDPEWAPRALAHLDEVLLDHAHLEKKAAGEDGPRVEGKWVIFDEELSINTVGAPDGDVKFTLDALS